MNWIGCKNNKKKKQVILIYFNKRTNILTIQINYKQKYVFCLKKKGETSSKIFVKIKSLKFISN